MTHESKVPVAVAVARSPRLKRVGRSPERKTRVTSMQAKIDQDADRTGSERG